jgi:glycyl-tRNA synthetase alpha chain
MVLQRVDSVYDIEWAPGLKYREVRLREEVEQSKYVFGQVAIPNADFGAFHRDLFDKYYQLASALLAARLIWPALEHCLKCSHLFNILYSSNSIGVTERTAFILRIRQLAIGVAKAYVEGNTPAADDAATTAVVAGGGG